MKTLSTGIQWTVLTVTQMVHKISIERHKYCYIQEMFLHSAILNCFPGLTIRNGREEMDLEAGQFEDAEEDP